MVLLVTLLNPVILNLKAQSEQDDSKTTLLQVYRSLYSYKTENGTFPNTAGKSIQLSQLGELKPYLKNFVSLERVEIASNEQEFNVFLKKTLSNGENDILFLNSKKEFRRHSEAAYAKR